MFSSITSVLFLFFFPWMPIRFYGCLEGGQYLWNGRDTEGFRLYSQVSSTGWHLSSSSLLSVSPWDGGQGTYLQADCTFEGINCLVDDQIHLFHSVFLCLYSKYVYCKPVICTFFSRPVLFYSVWLSGSAGWSVSGSEHVVVFNFVMPWVLWTSWGRYHMEGNQDSDSGPAHRLHVQVLENSCYHRASQGCTSVQSPQSGLNTDSKSSLISQIFFFFFFALTFVCVFNGTSINLVTVWHGSLLPLS